MSLLLWDCPRSFRTLSSPGQSTDCKEPTGLVYDLQRFAIHDGPGIQTLVYMKGCPLRCLWCSTPQSQKPSPEILHIELHCKKYGRCVEGCPVGAIAFSEEEGPKIDKELCNSCGQCVEVCTNQALELVRNHTTVEGLFQEVDKDSPFYRRSNGGVTVGGGEPTMQHDFVTVFIKRCKQSYVHTAIETCGHAKWEHQDNPTDSLEGTSWSSNHGKQGIKSVC